MNRPEYLFSTIATVSERLRHRQLSSVDLVTDTLRRIEQLNPSLNAFITVMTGFALQAARLADAEIERGEWKGPLHGIPIALKDFYDTMGVRTTAAFVHFKDRVPARDAEVVTRLKAAGAIIIGKTNMHELGSGTTSLVSHVGAVHNPWNQNYIAGGSSGGSAAAVASGMVFATVDTDAVGSCRLPAACCGVTGFKATYNLISNKGILYGEPAEEMIIRLSHAAITCRSAEDAALLLNILADPTTPIDYHTGSSTAKKFRIGVVTNYQGTDAVRGSFAAAVDVLTMLGHTTSEIEAPLSPPFDVTNIEQDRQTIVASLFKDVDLLVLPTTTESVPSIDHAGQNPMALSPANTFFANYYALPAVSIPCGFSQSGLPLGLQIVGAQSAETDVLALARAFQHASLWHQRHPELTEIEN